MLPGYKPFKIYKGDTFAFRLSLDSGNLNYNISSHTFLAQIKEKGKSAAIAEFDYTIENAVGGVVLLTLPASESANLIGGRKYEYDVQMTHSGVVSTILYGPVVVVADVSS
jgi:hypothetical protein